MQLVSVKIRKTSNENISSNSKVIKGVCESFEKVTV